MFSKQGWHHQVQFIGVKPNKDPPINEDDRPVFLTRKFSHFFHGLWID